ncbi:MAB_1171c family putative transporter [Lipingzhangella sp. LS1_29]|uniref:MAB_1171c family putative transporter n=1 Tax=Lipingzhangella rawalii TaxID=2055835 RepID=A0ABU2H8J6_9ACTN|nr:MAB_1171c family putative transporter [Lipingzhangella rawalii]MDS1270919.1 MAB_1171c family putative transporter [Lipingzhangella rawalii]
MLSPIETVVLVLLWLVVAVRIPSLSVGSSQRALWTVFFTLALSRTVPLPLVREWVSTAAGGQDIMPLVHHLLGIICAAALLRFISLVTCLYNRRPWAQLYQTGGAVVVGVCLTLLYALTPEQVHASTHDLLTATVDRPAALAYWILLQAYLGFALALAAKLFWHVARDTSEALLKTAFRLIWLGLVLNVCYAIYKTCYVVLHALGVGLSAVEVNRSSELLLGAAVTLMAVGACLPGLLSLRRIVETYRSLRRLSPLWRVIVGQFPEVALSGSEPSALHTGVLGQLRFRLYRRIIEIRDGILQLRYYLDPAVEKEVEEFLRGRAVPESERAAMAEACWIEAGLRAARADVAPHHVGCWTGQGGVGVDEEAVWLSQVSHAHSRSTLPALFAARREQR